MPWDENRRLKIKILKPTPQHQDAVVEFEITEDNRVNFHKALEYLLAAFINVGGEITNIIEINDSENGAPTSIEIQVVGPREQLVAELQKSVNSELKSFSVRMR